MSQIEQPPPPAGWYPFDATRQRYWDGTAWTDNYAPAVTQPAVVVVPGRRGTNHAFHLIMSIVTIGLWIPVWIIVSIANSGKR